MIPGTKRRTFKSQAELRPYLSNSHTLTLHNFSFRNDPLNATKGQEIIRTVDEVVEIFPNLPQLHEQKPQKIRENVEVHTKSASPIVSKASPTVSKTSASPIISKPSPAIVSKALPATISKASPAHGETKLHKSAKN